MFAGLSAHFSIVAKSSSTFREFELSPFLIIPYGNLEVSQAAIKHVGELKSSKMQVSQRSR